MTRMCDICGVRPAVGTVRRVRPGQPPETLHLCEIHLAEQRMSGLGSGFGGLSMFDDFFSRFLGDSPGGGTVRSTARSDPRVEQVDVTELFSDATNELLQRAARAAVDWGNPDIDTDHLLHAALDDEVVVHVLEQVGADPKSIAAQIEDEAERGSSTAATPSLTPDAKRAILAAYDEARELGVSYIGPEHILLALARDDDTEAGEILRRFGLSHTKLRGAVVRGVDQSGQAQTPARRSSSTSTAATSPPSPAKGSSTRSSAGPTRSSRPSRSCRAGRRTTRS
jgi:ATP-dependent Clp protease ATP-binding subunit ClpC